MDWPLTLDITGQDIQLDAAPLERSAFAPFGDVIENPRPGLHPSAAFPTPSSSSPSPPFAAVPANQGTAIKYQDVTSMTNFYGDAPSGRPSTAVTNLFVCAARVLGPGDTLAVSVLERHPYTNQTFIPLSSGSAAPCGPAGRYRYLVIVAPSLSPGPDDVSLRVRHQGSDASSTTTATATAAGEMDGRTSPLPEGGLPDVRRLKAFVAAAGQAVTYSAGTWHAPMIGLGKEGATVDFVVVQFANGVADEDCQEVFLSSTDPTDMSARVLVRIPDCPKGDTRL